MKKIIKSIKKTKQDDWYSYDELDKTNATYRMVYSERSSGKTYGLFKKFLIDYVKNGKQFVLIRRWRDDMSTKNMNDYFNGLEADGVVEKVTNGEWDRVIWKNRRFYLAKFDDELQKVICDNNPMGHGYALNTWEHDKGGTVPEVTNICFDEFITRGVYLKDEFVIFMNVLSTIIRQRDNVVIYMCGNTVNKDSIYFKEMGLYNVKKQEQGTIDIYQYGDSKLTVAVEYPSSVKKSGHKSDKYFAFDNPKLQMITGGAWEIDLYPHCPIDYTPSNVKRNFFIIWGDDILHCEVIKKDRMQFVYVHMKTTPLKFNKKDIIYQVEHDPRPNFRRRLTHPCDNIDKLYYSFFIKEKVFYQDNETGEIMRNYLNWSRTI